MMTSSETLQARIDKGCKDIAKAEKEVRELQAELKDGTLDRLKLQSGLQNLQTTICEIGAQLPTFGK
jgi:hypothetical protein